MHWTDIKTLNNARTCLVCYKTLRVEHLPHWRWFTTVAWRCIPGGILLLYLHVGFVVFSRLCFLLQRSSYRFHSVHVQRSSYRFQSVHSIQRSSHRFQSGLPTAGTDMKDMKHILYIYIYIYIYIYLCCR